MRLYINEKLEEENIQEIRIFHSLQGGNEIIINTDKGYYELSKKESIMLHKED